MPRDPLAAEIGAVVGTLERELRLEVAAEIAALRAWRAEAAAQLAGQIGPAGPQGEPGKQGEPGPPAVESYAPDDVAVMVGKAIALLAETQPLAAAIPPGTHHPPPPTVNVNLPPQRAERIRVVKHDDKGRILEIERGVA